ncbi:O-antigen polysaccharide polymerase Wzy [Acinetobacter pragensis]|uniref:O-antigen polysaccharide polymerase Wzy n=1 Tax=Acinetobacter pragensis TaxID=1806892 RepID=UPI00333FCE60
MVGLLYNLGFAILSIFAYIFSPEKYNFNFILFLTCIFLIQVFKFSIDNSKESYLNFYNIFFFGYFFVNYFYPSILYPIDSEFFSIFTINFNELVISKATALSNICASFFMLGVSLNNVNKKRKYFKEDFIIRHNKISLLTSILIIIFFMTIGKDYLSGNFAAQSSLSLYILQILSSVILINTIIFFKWFKYQNNKMFFNFNFIFYISIFLMVGDRGPALSLMIVAIILYSDFVKKIKLYKSLPIALVGLVLMHVVGEGRTTKTENIDSNIISRGLENFNLDVNGLYYMTHDFSVNAFTLYYGYDWVENNGINYGETFIKNFISVIPFLQGFLESAFKLNIKTSSEFFTDKVLGSNATWGIGTNLVSDVYISTGLLGCIFLFFCFGCYINHCKKNYFYINDMKSVIIYISLISFALYYSRTGMFFPIRFILWTLFIYIFLRSFNFIKKEVYK